jgi:hypothetical protein
MASCAAGERRNQWALCEEVEVEEIQNRLQPLLVLLSFVFEEADRNRAEFLQAPFSFVSEEVNRNRLALSLVLLVSVFEVEPWIPLKLLQVLLSSAVEEEDWIPLELLQVFFSFVFEEGEVNRNQSELLQVSLAAAFEEELRDHLELLLVLFETLLFEAAAGNPGRSTLQRASPSSVSGEGNRSRSRLQRALVEERPKSEERLSEDHRNPPPSLSQPRFSLQVSEAADLPSPSPFPQVLVERPFASGPRNRSQLFECRPELGWPCLTRLRRHSVGIRRHRRRVSRIQSLSGPASSALNRSPPTRRRVGPVWGLRRMSRPRIRRRS